MPSSICKCQSTKGDWRGRSTGEVNRTWLLFSAFLRSILVSCGLLPIALCGQKAPCVTCLVLFDVLAMICCLAESGPVYRTSIELLCSLPNSYSLCRCLHLTVVLLVHPSLGLARLSVCNCFSGCIFRIHVYYTSSLLSKVKLFTLLFGVLLY